MLVLRYVYRQETCYITSAEQSTPIERELSACLFSCSEYWRYSIEREQELEAQYLLLFLIKFSERKRRVNDLRQCLDYCLN